MASERQGARRSGAAGLVFVGCFMVGIAIGLLTGAVAPAILGGLGIGFVAMAIVRAVTGEW